MGAEPRTSAPVDLPVHLIRFDNRQRPISRPKVENLRVSMRENKFFGAILVRPPLEGAEHFRGVIGAHRWTAWRAEGHATIPAHVRILSDDEALQIEIDENLVREDLTSLERAEAIAARFQVWSRRFPERVSDDGGVAKPKRGRPANSDKMSEFLGGAPQSMGFAAETAAQLGLNEKTVRRAFGVVAGVSAEVRRQLHGTPIAKNEGLLRQLAALGDREEQAAVAEILISGRTKSVADALAYAAGREPSKKLRTPVDATVKAFRKLWGDASPSGRIAILHDLDMRKLPGGYTIIQGAADA